MAEPYRADHVGSLLRPPELVAARWAFEAGQLSREEYNRLADAMIPHALAMQQEVGLDIFTDGEYRRTWWAGSLAEVIDGLIPNPDPPPPSPAASGWRSHTTHELVDPAIQEDARRVLRPTTELIAGKRLRLTERIAGREAAFLKRHAPGPWKITLAGLASSAGGSTWFKPGISDQFYASAEELLEQLIGFVHQEVMDLIADGCSYIQLDSLRYLSMIDPRRRQALIDAGKDLEEELEKGLRIDNACLAGARGQPGVTVGHHICRGNNRGSYIAEGGYEPVAERLFTTMNVDRFLLEYDSERAGGFAPLRFVPKDKMVVLGLVSTKVPELESKDDLLRRIDEAAKYVPIENLAISPQCGFASIVTGQPLTWDQQRRKLELVMDVARTVWG